MTHEATEFAGRFDVGQVISLSFAIVRERWITLALLVLGVGVAPNLIGGLLVRSDYRAGDHDLRAFALHGAASLAPALLGHFTIAAVVAASLAPKARAGFVGALRSVAAASPILLPVWLASEYDTFTRLWNDWTQAYRPPAGIGARLVDLLALIGLDIAVAVIAVFAVGVFTPVVLSEHRGLRASLIRSWRLMSGSRWKVAGLYVAFVVTLVIVTALEGIAAVWLRSATGSPSAMAPWISRAILTVIVSGWGVFVAASYLDLRRLHDGALPDQLADVFA